MEGSSLSEDDPKKKSTPMYFKKRKKGDREDLFYGTKDQKNRGHIVKNGNKIEYWRDASGKTWYDARQLRHAIDNTSKNLEGARKRLGELASAIQDAHERKSRCAEQLNIAVNCKCGDPQANCVYWRKNGSKRISQIDNEISSFRRRLNNVKGQADSLVALASELDSLLGNT